MYMNPDYRQAILRRFNIKLFPKIMQMILKEHINPRGLKSKFQQNDIVIPLRKNEMSLLEQLPNIDDFTVELCYKILRYDKLILQPSCKWGNDPRDTEVQIADDIQRIINATNAIHSEKPNVQSDVEYNNFLKNIKDITKRVDTYLQTDTCLEMYKEKCSSVKNLADEPTQTEHVIGKINYST